MLLLIFNIVCIIVSLKIYPHMYQMSKFAPANDGKIDEIVRKLS